MTAFELSSKPSLQFENDQIQEATKATTQAMEMKSALQQPPESFRQSGKQVFVRDSFEEDLNDISIEIAEKALLALTGFPV